MSSIRSSDCCTAPNGANHDAVVQSVVYESVRAAHRARRKAGLKSQEIHTRKKYAVMHDEPKRPTAQRGLPPKPTHRTAGLEISVERTRPGAYLDWHERT